MTTAIIIFIAILIIFLIVKVVQIFWDQIQFYTTGLDSKFSLSEISMLWKLAQITELEEPKALFWSVPALSRCIANIIESAKAQGKEDSPKTQDFLSKLYKYRTKIELKSDNKKGLDSTRSLDTKQKLRIIYPGKGVFLSEIMNCGRELIIKMPKQDGIIKIKGEDWVGKEVNVYLWRKGDASYVFDTNVISSGVFLGQNSLSLAHSDKLLRVQKRKSVRCACHIFAELYIIKSNVINFDEKEKSHGYKCLLEDISEDGAMIRIGGKGVTNVQMKLQFDIDDELIIMYGVIRSVEYNEQKNQSRLHYECTHINPAMKNKILTFVYKVMPENEKEVAQAIHQIEEDESEENGSKTNTQSTQTNDSTKNDVTNEGDSSFNSENQEEYNDSSEDETEFSGVNQDVPI